MRISQRLVTIGLFIHENSNVFDVGADHGLLEKYLIENHKVNSIVAVENKRGPYSILKNNLKNYDVQCILSDGINDLDEKTDTLVIAGMGGLLIERILKSHIDKLKSIKQIVVDAHRDQEIVRRTIVSLGFKIEKEQLLKESNIYYNIISFVKGNAEYSLNEYEFGLNIKNDPLFKDYKTEMLVKMNLNLNQMKKSKNPSLESITYLEERIKRLETLWTQLNC